MVRLGSRTGFSFLNLTERIAQMQLSAGTMIVHIRSLSGGERDEIDTPNLAVELERPGTYAVHVSASGDTTVVDVIHGAAIAAGGGQDFTISAHQRAEFR
ncbi:prolin-rich exported protein, partial [mine drainage metagenome]